jgi:hypothetical protein
MSVACDTFSIMRETIMSIGNTYFQERASIDPESDCLLWLGRMSAKKGRADTQAVMKLRSPKSKEPSWLSVARYTWELTRPQLDPTSRLRKMCDTPRCVLPSHYVEISKFCPAGHKRTEKNTYVISRMTWTNAKGETKPTNTIQCRICSAESTRRIRLREKQNSANLVK